MQCQRIERLMPLYVGGDLAEADLAAVVAHVAGCARCAALADEFRASVALVRQYSEPAVDAAFYAAIRGDVLRRVSALSPPWRWVRPAAIAASVALVAIAIALAVLALRSRQDIGSPGIVESDPEPSAPTIEPYRGPGNVAPDEPRRRPTQRVVYLPARRHRRPPAPAHGDLAIQPVDTNDVLRIEYQTSDPNVRIIWFVPKGTGASSDTAKTGA